MAVCDQDPGEVTSEAPGKYALAPRIGDSSAAAFNDYHAQVIPGLFFA